LLVETSDGNAENGLVIGVIVCVVDEYRIRFKSLPELMEPPLQLLLVLIQFPVENRTEKNAVLI